MFIIIVSEKIQATVSHTFIFKTRLSFLEEALMCIKQDDIFYFVYSNPQKIDRNLISEDMIFKNKQYVEIYFS